MSEIKVSVIVPIYNVEKYLRKSLESIISQTLEDIEIICVNDGSKDNSRDILEEYAQKDPRIVIIDKENGGLSSARNAGMEVARGEYIGFVDSDDWIEDTMYEKLYYNAKLNESEMVICSVHKYDDKRKQIVDNDKYYTLEYFEPKFFDGTFNHLDTKDFLLQVCVMAWNKIYKREVIEAKRAKFPEGLIFEDGPFFFSIYFDMQRVSLVNEFLYYYRINRPHSIIDKGGKNFIDLLDVTKLMFTEIVKLPYYNEIKNCFFKEKFNDALYRYKMMNKKYKKQFFNKMKEFYCSIDLEGFDEEYPYSGYVLSTVKDNNYKEFEYHNLKTKIKDKIMMILYTNPELYTIRIFKRTLKIKKNIKMLDIWYKESFLYVKMFNMKTLKINFPYREFKAGEQ